jgi:hypothetical protein
MTLARELDKCPCCKEPIVSGALRCKHCHADLSISKKGTTFWAAYNNFRTGFLCGLLFALMTLVLAYLHFTGAD